MSIVLQVFDAPDAAVSPYFNPSLTPIFLVHTFLDFCLIGKHF